MSIGGPGDAITAHGDGALVDLNAPAAERAAIARHAQRLKTVRLSARDLADLEAKLDPAKFVRIHRAALLNLDFVAEVQPWPGGRLLVRLKDDQRTTLEVARDRVRALKERLGM